MKTAKPSIDFTIKCICFKLISFYWLITGVQAQEFRFITSRNQQTIGFELIKNLIIIPIHINEKGSFNFILDTGVNPLIVTDTTLKDNLNIHYQRAIKISGYGNLDEVDAILSTTKVKLGDAEIESMPSVFLKEDVVNLSRIVGKQISGLIGYNFFNSFIVKVNYNNSTLKFIAPTKKVKMKGEKVAFDLVDNKPYINLSIKQEGIGEVALRALVDCGASHAVSLEALNGSPFPEPQSSIESNLGTGLSGDIKGRAGRISNLKIGSFIFNDLVASYPKYNIGFVTNKGRNANLGAEILQRFNITYDYRNQCFYLKKNGRFNFPFEYDMAGIEIFRETVSVQRTIINKVDQDSPASVAGLRQGDEITSINFININHFSVDEISNVFKAKNGKFVVMEIYRDNDYQIKVLKLKKRI